MSEPPPPYSVRADNLNRRWFIWLGPVPVSRPYSSHSEAMIERDRLNAEWIKGRDEQEAEDE